MNNELKEILDNLKYCKEHDEENNYYPEDIFSKDDPYKLLDYITNLQEENERLKEWKEDLLEENIKLEDIRKEAIEYIMTELITEWDIENDGYVSGSDLPVDAITPLLNILQGEDNEIQILNNI